MSRGHRRSKVFADICLLRSSCTSLAAAEDQQLVGGTWNSVRVEIPCNDNANDLWQLCRWNTNVVIPFHQWLCWMDYNLGILFCDMSQLPTPIVSFLRFPLPPELPSANIFTGGNNHHNFLYRGASVVDHGRALKFVNVTRHDGLGFGALKPGTGFTVTCHTLVLGGGTDDSMAWEEDYTVTSGELWEANPPERLPRGVLMFPQVDIDMPHAVHFLFIEFGFVNKKMWVVSIDMSTQIVDSFSLYINGMEGLQTDDADLIEDKSMGPLPFLPCELRSRERQDME